MSWQAASFAALGLVLVIGFAWYERTRPSSRLVALVAALAALAVAGRLVLTPFPNVVATTDIAFITGFALGAAPGFAVGALAAPISNVWLGQGPWTVWEMGGWGMAGLLGAAFGALGGRSAGRLVLALACAGVGFAYGALLDFSFMVSYGGEVSLDRYVAVSAAGLPFNVAHATGNFLIALAAGPALVAMIARYRERLEFRWHPAGALPAALIALALAGAAAPQADAAGVGAARAWLESAREPGGGYAATPGTRPSAQMTGWAMLGLEAAGRNPRDVGPRGATPVDWLADRADGLRDPNELELAILALEGAGLDARRFAGRDLVAALARAQRSDGSWAGQVNLTAYGALAMRAAGEGAAAARAAEWLAGARNRDGGWGFSTGRPSDPDSTGAAMQALAREGGAGLADAVAYLRRTQRREGGWGLNETGVTNTQSTAWAVQGLVAAGVDPAGVRRAGRSGLDYLAARQRADGSYAYSSASDQTPVWVTAQALLAVSREALPIEPVPRSASPEPTPDVARGPSSQPGDPGGGAAAPGAAAAASNARPGSHREGAGARRAGGARRTAAERTASDRVRRAGPAAATLAARQAAAAADDGDSAAALALAGLGALALALAAGYLWYHRTLP